MSPLFGCAPSFANALVQNIGGGNTMVFNAEARELLVQAGEVDVVSHDWWTYLLISGAGGRVIYDPEPSLGYRQHEDNAIGANLGWRSRLARYRGALGGRNRRWNQRNLDALQANATLLSPENRERLAAFAELRQAPLTRRPGLLRRSGVYAQTVSGKLGLYFAALLRKL